MIPCARFISLLLSSAFAFLSLTVAAAETFLGPIPVQHVARGSELVLDMRINRSITRR
jgi:hypothetical protein